MHGVDLFIILLAKLLTFCIRLFRLGSGATWPGEIALRLRLSLLQSYSSHVKIILVAGTNGKTTTVKMIESIMKKAGKRVARNDSGANLDNGLVSTFILHTSWSGRVMPDYFIFEVDEATLPNILKSITPDILVLMNLFRDQLDRYGEIDMIAEKWLQAFLHRKMNISVIINGDDPHLAYIGNEIKDIATVAYFGINNPELFLPKMQHATDSIYCPACGNRLTFGGVYFSHLGKYACGQCGFTHPEISLQAKEVKSPLAGVYNVYNTMAATMVGKALLIDHKHIEEGFRSFTPAFGRMEEVFYCGKRIKILLSKNPTGFNESLRTMQASAHQGPLLIVLNDRIPDGTDVSWIWDVDIETISKQEVFVSGDRAFDMAIRLKYAGVEPQHIHVYQYLQEAITSTVQSASERETIWVFATYSAMLEVRKIVVGRKIL